MNPKKFWISVLLPAFLLLAVSASADSFYVHITTTPNNGPLAGPLSLQFDLTDGGFAGDANNSVTLYGFTAIGGSISGPSGPESFSDAEFLSSKNYGFTTATTELSFFMDVTNNPDDLFPDQLAIYLFDGDLPIMTTDNLGAGALLAMDLGTGPTVTPQVFAGTDGYEGITAAVSPVPEPATIVLIGLAAPLVALCRKRRTS